MPSSGCFALALALALALVLGVAHAPVPVCAQGAARASEAVVRVSVFVRGQPGGFLVRVRPTETFDDFVALGKLRLKQSSVCAVTNAAGEAVRSLSDIIDDGKYYFHPCQDGGSANGAAEVPIAVQPVPVRPAPVGTESDQQGRPRMPARIPSPEEPPQAQGSLAAAQRAPQTPPSQQQQQQQQQQQYMPPPVAADAYAGQAAGTFTGGQAFQAPPATPQQQQQAQQVGNEGISFSGTPGVQPIGISWTPDLTTTWGRFAYHATAELFNSSAYTAIMLVEPATNTMQYPRSSNVSSAYERAIGDIALVKEVGQKYIAAGQRVPVNFPVLHVVPPNLAKLAPPLFRGSKNIALYVTEEQSDIPIENALATRETYNALIASSEWARKLLDPVRERLPPIVTLHHGVDDALWYPRPRKQVFDKSRFVVFSGGMLEYHKGQDLVVHAFKDLVTEHPELKPLLVVWWPSRPGTVGGLDLTGHVTGLPEFTPDGKPMLKKWLVEVNGLPEDSVYVIDVDATLPQIAEWMPEFDACVFPARGEGTADVLVTGCMASGVPTLVAANTANLDLIHMTMLKNVKVPWTRHPGNYGIRHAYVLWKKLIITNKPGWGEVWPWEIRDELLRIHSELQTGAAQDKTKTAVFYMSHLTWRKQIAEAVALFDRV